MVKSEECYQMDWQRFNELRTRTIPTTHGEYIEAQRIRDGFNKRRIWEWTMGSVSDEENENGKDLFQYALLDITDPENPKLISKGIECLFAEDEDDARLIIGTRIPQEWHDNLGNVAVRINRF